MHGIFTSLQRHQNLSLNIGKSGWIPLNYCPAMLHGGWTFETLVPVYGLFHGWLDSYIVIAGHQGEIMFKSLSRQSLFAHFNRVS